jgi:hypothetical protein
VTISQRVKIPEAEGLPGGPATQVVSLKCRLIEARTRTGEKIRLVTSLLDHRCYPAHELVLGYHVRWENELTYDEVKTHFLTVKHGTLKTIFRSKSPDGVRQEAVAMLVVYNLVRGLMREAGERKNLAPLELSFVDSLEAVRQSIARFELASNARTTFLAQRLLDDIAECVIDRPRRPRRNPRKVRQKMSNFKLKREGDHGETYDPSFEFQLTDFRSELRAQ